MSVILGAELQALPPGETDLDLTTRHSTFGILLLGVMLMRFAWRLRNLNPVVSYTISALQKRAAISMHWFLYAVVLSQCTIGVLQLLADGATIAISQYVIVETPAFRDDTICERLNDVHASLAKLIYIAVAVHVCAAVYHQIFGVVDEAHR